MPDSKKTEDATAPAEADVVQTRQASLPVDDAHLDKPMRRKKVDLDAIRALMEATHPATRNVSPQEEPLADAIHHACAAYLAGQAG